MARPWFTARASRRVLVTLALFAAPACAPDTALAADPTPARPPVYQLLHAGMLIDGTGAAAKRGVDVLVKDGRIEAIGTGIDVPPGAVEIDLRSYTVLPGLIDCHTHLTNTPAGPDDQLRAVTRGAADAANTGVSAARRTLEAA